MGEQLTLFGESDQSRPRAHASRRRSVGDEAALDARFERLRPIAAALPAGVRFGTSSWSFPGWRDLVYPGRVSASQLARDGLRHYVRHPLLGTVGIDRSYYAPIPDADLAAYAAQLPEAFPCCAKAPASVTSVVQPSRSPAAANPSFLSVARFVDEVIEPFDRSFRDHVGPFILQFPPAPKAFRLEPSMFVDRLDQFLDGLPRQFPYAIEIREPRLLGLEYRDVLARHRAAHVYNFWTRMPLPEAQAAIIDPTSQPVVVVRLLLRPGAGYEEQREAFAPFDRLAAPSEEMRDQVTGILARAVARRLPAFVLVNNKAEGSAPLTIEALAERLVKALRTIAPTHP